MSKLDSIKVIFLSMVLSSCSGFSVGEEWNTRDRLQMIELVNSYSHAIDNGLTSRFVDLFDVDAVFETKFPGVPSSTFVGHEEIRILAEGAKKLNDQGIQRRHILSNLVFHNQTSVNAEISCYVVIYSTVANESPSVGFTGAYEGSLVKRGDAWKISRWVLTSDTKVQIP